MRLQIDMVLCICARMFCDLYFLGLVASEFDYREWSVMAISMLWPLL